MLRELSILAITLNFTFTALHIPGFKNKSADALSRFEFQKFFEAAPDAVMSPVEIPQEFLHQLLFPTWTMSGKCS